MASWQKQLPGVSGGDSVTVTWVEIWGDNGHDVWRMNGSGVAGVTARYVGGGYLELESTEDGSSQHYAGVIRYTQTPADGGRTAHHLATLNE
jgi:hypothetical protein